MHLQTVATHEIGHILGLAHTATPGAIMKPSLNFQEINVTATDDERLGIGLLYDHFVFESNNFCAIDVGVSAGFGSNYRVWAIRCPNLNGVAHSWNGSGTWVADVTGVVGRDIAVDPTGIPWMVQSGGDILRRTSKETSSGTWNQVAGCASDIGIGGTGSPGAVWMVQCGTGRLHKWSEAAQDWVQDNVGIARRVSVDG
jgi:hypothetical protein